MRKLRIGHLSTLYHTAFILKGNGWIEGKMGIETEWKLFPTGPEMVKAFAKGELDIGYLGLPPVMIAIDRGIALKCIAGGHMEGTVLTASEKIKSYEETGSIKETLEQLKGKTVGTPSKGSIHDVIVRAVLEEAGLQQDVSVENFDWADLVLWALENDEVQAAAGTPALAVLSSQFLNAKIILPPHAMWPYNPSYGIVATKDTIESHSDLLRGFLVLHEKACNLIREKPLTAAKLVAETVRIMDEKFIMRVYKVSPKYCASLSPEYLQSTMAFAPVLQKLGYINRSVTEQEVFHKSIIEGVHDQPPHYDDPLMLA